MSRAPGPGRPLTPLVLTAPEIRQLRLMARRRATPDRIATRARVVLACANGASNGRVAEALGVSAQLVGRWRARFVEGGVEALRGGSAPGRASEEAALARMEEVLAQPPPGGRRWTSRSLAARCGVSQPTATRLRRYLALRNASELRPAGLFAHGEDCALVLIDATASQATGRGAVAAAIEARARAASQLEATPRAGLKLRKFLGRVRGRIGKERATVVLGRARTPGVAARRFLHKHPRFEVCFLGAQRRFWALAEARLEGLPPADAADLEREADAWLDQPLQPGAFSWIAPR